MEYNRTRMEKNIPTTCKKLQDAVDELLWAQGILKLLPNLPKGGLKGKLESQLHDVINGINTNEGKLRTLVTPVLESIKSFESQLEAYDKLKKPGPIDIQNIRGFAHNVRVSIRTFRSTIDSPSYWE